MVVIRTNLHKVTADRNLKAKGGQINLKNNVSLKNVEDMNLNKDGNKGLRIGFGFDCNYEPEVGKIVVEGQVIYVEEAKLIDEIKESWEKNKVLPSAVMEEVLNAALHKGNIQAIKTAEDVGLPSPLPLPKVSNKKK